MQSYAAVCMQGFLKGSKVSLTKTVMLTVCVKEALVLTSRFFIALKLLNSKKFVYSEHVFITVTFTSFHSVC